MSSRLILNLGLLIMVVALSLYIMYAPAPAPPPSKPKLTSLKSDTIDQITIHHGNMPDTVLQKTDKHWRLVKPISMPANDYQVQKLAHLAETASQSQYPVEADKLSAMGLDKPRLTVTLNDIILKYGTTDPINRYRYILAGDKVHLVIDTISHILLQAPESLGDPALLPEHNDITKLALPQFTLSKDKDGNWQINGKTSTSLSQDDLTAFIDDWRFAEALRISFFDKLDAKDKTLPTAVITMAGHDTPFTFYLNTTSKDFILIRTNPNIRYHLLKDKQQTLLKLPKPELPPKAPPTS